MQSVADGVVALSFQNKLVITGLINIIHFYSRAHGTWSTLYVSTALALRS
jgi:hypothetical protein